MGKKILFLIFILNIFTFNADLRPMVGSSSSSSTGDLEFSRKRKLNNQKEQKGPLKRSRGNNRIPKGRLKMFLKSLHDKLFALFRRDSYEKENRQIVSDDADLDDIDSEATKSSSDFNELGVDIPETKESEAEVVIISDSEEEKDFFDFNETEVEISETEESESEVILISDSEEEEDLGVEEPDCPVVPRYFIINCLQQKNIKKKKESPWRCGFCAMLNGIKMREKYFENSLENFCQGQDFLSDISSYNLFQQDVFEKLCSLNDESIAITEGEWLSDTKIEKYLSLELFGGGKLEDFSIFNYPESPVLDFLAGIYRFNNVKRFREQNIPQVVIINTGMHWVSVLICPHGRVFFSDSILTSENEENINDKVKRTVDVFFNEPIPESFELLRTIKKGVSKLLKQGQEEEVVILKNFAIESGLTEEQFENIFIKFCKKSDDPEVILLLD